MKNISFTKREEELMDFLWSYGQPLSATEMLDQCEDRSWSDHYLRVMLRSLERKGAIEYCSLEHRGTQYARRFRCTVTKEEYYVRLAESGGIGAAALIRAAGASMADSEEERKELLGRLNEVLQDYETKTDSLV